MWFGTATPSKGEPAMTPISSFFSRHHTRVNTRFALAAAAALLLCSNTLAQPNDTSDEPTDSDAAKTRSLFNGKDLSGWHADVPAADDDRDIRPSFIVRQGETGPMVVSMGTPQGHLISDAIYENYRLEIEYRFAAEAGNCGVLIHASTPRALYSMFPKSIEVQMHSTNAGDFWCIGENIEVENMADHRAGPEDNWGGGPKNSRRITNLTDDSEHDVGQWNRMVIETLGDKIRVWVNGDLVNDGFDCTARRGQIAIQSEGVEVEFRRFDFTPIDKLSPREDRPAWPGEKPVTASPSSTND
jgi:3-keto-disaccharide hydrolase